MALQGPRVDEVIRGLDGYEQMEDNFAEQTEAYWRLWSPLGEPIVCGVDARGGGATRVSMSNNSGSSEAHSEIRLPV